MRLASGEVVAVITAVFMAVGCSEMPLSGEEGYGQSEQALVPALDFEAVLNNPQQCNGQGNPRPSKRPGLNNAIDACIWPLKAGAKLYDGNGNELGTVRATQAAGYNKLNFGARKVMRNRATGQDEYFYMVMSVYLAETNQDISAWISKRDIVDNAALTEAYYPGVTMKLPAEKGGTNNKVYPYNYAWKTGVVSALYKELPTSTNPNGKPWKVTDDCNVSDHDADDYAPIAGKNGVLYGRLSMGIPEVGPTGAIIRDLFKATNTIVTNEPRFRRYSSVAALPLQLFDPDSCTNGKLQPASGKKLTWIYGYVKDARGRKRRGFVPREVLNAYDTTTGQLASISSTGDDAWGEETDTETEAPDDAAIWAPWTSWENLGGPMTNLAVYPSADGRLELFGRGANGYLHHKWQLAANGTTGWSAWEPIGCCVHPADSITVRDNVDGRLEVFVRGNDNFIYHTWQLSPNGAWSGLYTLPGAGGLVKPMAAANADWRLEVFAIGTNGNIYHTYQTNLSGTWNSSFASLGGSWYLTEPIGWARNADGRLEIFVRAPDGQLHHQWQTSANGPWYGSFVNFSQGFIGANPTVGRNSSGGLDVFAVGNDAQVWHKYQTGGGWSSWSNFGTAPPVMGKPAVIPNLDGRLEVFIRSTDGVLVHWYQQSGTPTGWSPWSPVYGITLTSDVIAGRNADGRLEVFGTDADGNVWHTWQ